MIPLRGSIIEEKAITHQRHSQEEFQEPHRFFEEARFPLAAASQAEEARHEAFREEAGGTLEQTQSEEGSPRLAHAAPPHP